MIVQHADAAVRYGLPYGGRICRAVDAEIGVAAVFVEIKRPGPERIAGPARHAVRELRIAVGVTPYHVIRRPPRGPLGLALDDRRSLEFETSLANTDAVANCAFAVEDVVEVVKTREYKDLTRSVLLADAHLSRLKFFGQNERFFSVG